MSKAKAKVFLFIYPPSQRMSYFIIFIQIMKKIIVVNNPKNWKFHIPEAEIV